MTEADLAKTLEGLSAAADKEADDIRYYSGGSDYNASLAKFHNALVEAYRTGQLIVVDHPQATSPVDSHTAWLEANTNNKIEAGGYTERAIFDMGWDAAMPNLAAKDVEIARLRELSQYWMEKAQRLMEDQDSLLAEVLPHRLASSQARDWSKP